MKYLEVMLFALDIYIFKFLLGRIAKGFLFFYKELEGKKV
jgi:hypothetical protein